MWTGSIKASGQGSRKSLRGCSIRDTSFSTLQLIDYNSPSKDPFLEDIFVMALISLQDVSIGFGGPRLLEEINLQIEGREWVGLLGRNGSGKSTLLKLIAGEILPHEGTIARQQGLRLAYLPQEVPQDLNGRVRAMIESGLDAAVGTLDEEHQWQR